MIRAVGQAFRIQSAMSCNRFLFWAKKLPLIRRLFPDSLYGAVDAKRRLMTAVEVLKILYAFGGKFLYLFLACGLPAYLSGEGAPSRSVWDAFLWVLFFMSFFCGSILQSGVLSPTLLKYTCVRQMGMEARACIAATTGRDNVLCLLTFLPALLAASALLGAPLWQGLLAALELAACRALGEFLHVWFYHKTKKQPGKSPWFIMLVVLAAGAAAYAPLIAGAALPMTRLLANPAVAVALLGCGGWAGLWLIRYPDYRALVLDTCRADTVSTAAVKQNAARNAFRDVQMREGDLTAEDGGDRVAALSGYAYLNALFFRRHRRLLRRPVRYVLLGVGLLFLLGLAGTLLFRETAAGVLERLPGALPTFVFVMYLICNSLGQRICKAMFYNCDISLLRYGWYRQRSVVLRNFTIRLGRVAGLNLLTAAAVCAALLALVRLSGAAIPAHVLVPFLLSILFLAALFSVHPLFLYYVFQPYTSQLAVKNPFFFWINWGMYMVCVMCLQIRQPPEFFALLVLGATILYTAVALALVWKRAPRTFRVK